MLPITNIQHFMSLLMHTRVILILFKYGNVSTGLTAKRDLQNTNIIVSGLDVIFLQFTPMENRDYIVRVSEIRIDKPDDVINDTTIEY